MSLFQELKRRNVFRVGIAYLALAWLLVEVADTLFPAFGIPDWAFRFLVIMLIFGFVPTLIFSWAYEITPEGVKRETEVVRDRSITHHTAKRLDMLTIGLILVAIGFIAVDRLWLKSGYGTDQPVTASEPPVQADAPVSEPPSHPNSIAVLPFVNRSANPEDVFFVDGIHDDLLTYISQIGSIKTISRTSVMQYRDTTRPIPEIARELGVTSVLEGGVQRAGTQVRINVQLIDARTDDHIWSRTYDRDMTAANIFAIQSEIAEEIALALRATLTPEARKRIDSVPTESLPALEAYFIGRQSMVTRTIADLATAATQFETAVDLDPEFALAWVGLADTYLLQTSYSGLPWAEFSARSESAANRALQLDPGLGEGYASLAKKKDWAGDDDEAEELFRMAMDLNPNYAPAYQWYGEMLGALVGRVDEAIELSRKAMALDPKSAIIVNDYAEVLESAGRFEEALLHYRRAIEIEPGFAHGYNRIGMLKARAFGKLDEAVPALLTGLEIEPESWYMAANLSVAFLSLGGLEEAAGWEETAETLTLGIEVPEFSIMRAVFLEEKLSLDRIYVSLKHDPRNRLLTTLLTRQALIEENTSLVRSLLESTYRPLATDSPEISKGTLFQAVDLAMILLDSGETEKADVLLVRCLEYIQKMQRFGAFGYGILDVRIHALRGNNQEALRVLSQAAEAGWRWNWWYYLQHDPALQPLHGETEFQAAREIIEADMAEQLKRVRSHTL